MRANPTIEFYIIAKVPQEENDPAQQIYLIRTRRNNGQWTTEPLDLIGTSDARWFLNDNGVEERDIALLPRNFRSSVAKSVCYAALG